MIEPLIRFCVRNPVVVLVLTAALLGFGIDAWNNKTVDAIPDISENQVIVVTRWPGRSPEDVEDQITYPLSTQLAGVRGVKEIRSLSGFGFSQVYVVFDEPIRLLPSSAIDDFYEARTRVLEKLSSVRSMLPDGVNPVLGPDATALGQIFMYTVDGPYDLATLRSLQDFVVRYELQAVAGVAEVASVGGMVREYQVDVSPEELRHYGAGMNDIVRGIRLANLDVGAKTIESGGAETIVRGIGFIKEIKDVENVVIGTMTPKGFMPNAMRMDQTKEALAANHRPLLVRDVATVRLGPAFRRGALADGQRERVGGVVAMRFGENPRDVIGGVRKAILRLNDPEVGILPEGVRVSPFYDRTQLIEETTETLEVALREELIITVIVVLFFLFHLRTSLIIATTLPLAVLISFVAMKSLGVDSNIMSLTGIAIAIGTMVDMGIVMTENIYRRLEEDGGEGNAVEIVEDAAVEVGPALLTAVATTVVSFIPIFFLEDQEGKLFRPLAWTKSLALVAAALVGVLVVPVLCRLFLTSKRARRKMVSFDKNRVSRVIRWAYEPTLRWALGHKLMFLVGPALIVILGLLALTGSPQITQPIRDGLGGRTSDSAMLDWIDQRFPGLGQEFMPALDEGSLLYMPSLLPAASLNQTLDVLKRQNAQIETIPEVAKVIGKLGRVESALDPAPIGMIETVVQLQPRSEWRDGITQDDIVAELMRATHTPGVLEGAGAWLQPIETRVIMLNSGIRAPLAAKLIGAPRSSDGRSMTAAKGVAALEDAANWVREVIQKVPGVAGPNVENLGGKPYLEVRIRREEVGHWGLTVQDVQDAITTAIGGKVVDTTVEGRERYGIRVAYPRERRDQIGSIDGVLVHGSRGPVPLSLVADISATIGPAAIKTEDGRLRLHVMFAAAGRDEGAVMEDVLQRIADARREHIDAGHPDPIPTGVAVEAAGRYESQARAAKRFRILIPICFAIILFLLYLNFGSWVTSLNVFAGLPVCIGGGLLLLSFFPDIQDFMFDVGLWDQPSSGPIYITVAVIVGFIALAGIATDDGVVIATYLDQSMRKRKPETIEEVRDATVVAGLRRIRPCLMTTATTIFALYPILASTGRGSDVAQPMALPAVGGMLAGLISLFIVPLVYCWIQELMLGRADDSGLKPDRAGRDGLSS